MTVSGIPSSGCAELVSAAVMSANERTETVFECIRGGAEDYLLKPVTRKEVQHMWQHVWRRQQQNALRVPHMCPEEVCFPFPSRPGVLHAVTSRMSVHRLPLHLDGGILLSCSHVHQAGLCVHALRGSAPCIYCRGGTSCPQELLTGLRCCRQRSPVKACQDQASVPLRWLRDNCV